MKKTVLFAIATSFALISYGQGKSEYSDFSIPTKDGQAFYERVDSSTKNKAEIFAACRKAFSDLFKNSSSVIEIEDKETGQILGKGATEFNHKIQLGINVHENVKFTINIQCKDNKFRIQVYDFTYKSDGTYSYSFEPLDRMLKNAKGWRLKFFPAFDNSIKLLIDLFETTIKNNLSQSDF